VARYLTATLFCEGREDARFLEHVLARQLTALGMSRPGFETGEVFTQRCRTVEEAARVAESVLTAARDFDLVFVHHDWNERGKVDALRKRLDRELPAETRIVGVVPVREMEAWPLADPAAFPRGGGGAMPLLPGRPKDVEAVSDPKQSLEKVLGRQYDERVADWVGERIDLGRLPQVPAYGAFLHDLTTALKELHFL
jgi:uncharacterized protein DUF4276